MLDAHRIILALGLTVLLCVPAPAQMQVNDLITGVLEKPQYRLEIPLTAPQLERARSATRVANAQLLAINNEFKELEGPARVEAMRKRRTEIALGYERELVSLLDPPQMKRLRQICLQMMGYNAFQRPAVRDELKLTDTQNAEVDAILQRAFESSRAFFGPGRPRDDNERKERARRSEQHLRITLAEILAVLSDDQKAAWTEMQGPPVRFP